MRLFLMILLGFSVVAINSRPSQSDDNNESQEEIEYEEDNAPSADDNLEEPRFGDEESSNQDTDQSRRLLELNRNNYLQKNLAEDQVPRSNLDVPDYKPTRSRDARNEKFYEATNNNDELQTYGKRRRYIENNGGNEQLEAAQHYTNHDVNNFKNNRIHNEMLLESPSNKRTCISKKAQTEEGELLFENNHDLTRKVDKNEYFNEPADVNQRSSYAKPYYNQMKPDKAIADANDRDNDFMYYNRERREAEKSNQGDAESISSVDSEKEKLEKSDSENEEMAIKRHIKKMSGDELEQLLNSLSEEKRALLKKIIDEDDISEKSYDSINKREITKKAGAVEDNGYIESGQSESSKLQGGFSALDITSAYPAQSSDQTTTNKQTDNMPDSTILSNQQKPSQETNSKNKADLNDRISIIDRNIEKSDNSFASDTDPNKGSAEIVPNEPISKIENKRETNTETMLDSFEDPEVESENTKEFRTDDSYFVPQDEDMSQFLDDVEQSRSYDSSKIYKRDVEDQSELDSKLKSLEESFPNANAYHDAGPYSGPLIRVKRKNAEQVMKKRSAAVLPDAKVGYYPYKSDNNDEDSDEGNEFDDDGFYDPAPNLVSSDNKNVDSNSEQVVRDNSCKLNAVLVDQLKSPINDGTMNLGSDTDNVLSGVEGVDENLMFSSGLRNRRKTEGSFVERVDGNSLVKPELSKLPNGETKSVSNNDVDGPNYQDNDSFGGYPRSYEGDLSRYKRIRRVKQSRISEASPSA